MSLDYEVERMKKIKYDLSEQYTKCLVEYKNPWAMELIFKHYLIAGKELEKLQKKCWGIYDG